MNNKEFWSNKTNLKCYEYKFVQSKLNEWKIENNITECCVIHHRDDTEEVRAYNGAHYERWGFDDNGDFIEGRYVQFMTKSAHSSYHYKGKHLSEETKTKMSNALKGENNPQYGLKGENSPNYGRHHSEETKAKISTANKGKHSPNCGKHLSGETKNKLRLANKGKHLSEETKAKLSTKHCENMKAIKLLYSVYKNNGGTKKWNDFRKSLTTGDITFSDYTITVFK